MHACTRGCLVIGCEHAAGEECGVHTYVHRRRRSAMPNHDYGHLELCPFVKIAT